MSAGPFDSRREARTTAEGELILLEDQDRSLWNRERIQEGQRVLERSFRLGSPGPYQLQAAIAGVHSEETTDWSVIAALYQQLAVVAPSPIVDLNRAVAVFGRLPATFRPHGDLPSAGERLEEIRQRLAEAEPPVPPSEGN